MNYWWPMAAAYDPPVHDVLFIDEHTPTTMAPHFEDNVWVKTATPKAEYL